MERKERKKNRLSSYDYSQNGAYFLTICTHERKPFLSKIFIEDKIPRLTREGQIMERLIGSVSIKYPTITVDHHVIMPDHIHLLVRVENGTGNPSPTVELSFFAKNQRFVWPVGEAFRLPQMMVACFSFRSEDDLSVRIREIPYAVLLDCKNAGFVNAGHWQSASVFVDRERQEFISAVVI